MTNSFLKYFLFLIPIISFSQQSKIDSSYFYSQKKIADSLTNAALNYEHKGNPSKMVECRYKALSIYEKIGDKTGTGIFTNTMYLAGFNLHNHNCSKALEYFNKCLSIAEEMGRIGKWSNYNTKGRIAWTLNNIAVTYAECFNNDSLELEFYLKSLSLREEIKDTSGIAQVLSNIGSIYEEKGDTLKALKNYYTALFLREIIGSSEHDNESYNTIGWTYFNMANSSKINNSKKNILLDSAFKYASRSMQIANKTGFKYMISHAAELLSEVYSKKEKYKEAFEMHILFKNIEDSTSHASALQSASKYEFEKKESLAEAEQEMKDAVTAEEKRKQKIITYSVSCGLFLVLLLALFIFRGYKQKQKANKELAEKNILIEKSKHIIEEKNKDITDSINYARRIQKAMLPHRKDIWTAFPQSFVLFKPKDIVSGDFYFFHKNNQTAFIASADCTGHGVPGAFMSMIGAGKLNDAVSQSTDTSEILSLLNKGIKSALKQSETDESATRDGMDIALCSVDTNARIVKYAGANRPIWIIRNGQTAVEEIKATKKAIGGFTEDSQHFDSHEIQFEKGDTFYISTDGFADTFGGNEAKKVTTKRFKEILVSIQDKTMKEQERHLDNFIEKWKGGTEQIDDILVIGVRL